MFISVAIAKPTGQFDIIFDTGGSGMAMAGSIRSGSVCPNPFEGFPMSQKTQRGTKRLCANCGSKFYDLARVPIVCPMCSTEFRIDVKEAKAELAAEPVAVKEVMAKAKAIVPKDFPAGDEVVGEELPEIAADDIVIDAEDAEIVPGDEEETFLETEDEAPSDVESFIDGPVDGEEEET